MNLSKKWKKSSVRSFAVAMAALYPMTSAQAADSAAFSRDQIDLPFILEIPENKQVLDRSLVDLAKSFFADGFALNETIADFQIRDPYEIQLSGIRVKAGLNARASIDSQGALVEARMLKTEITVAQISIHSTIVTNIGGVDARIRVDADCRDTRLVWNDDLGVFFRAALHTSGSQPQVDLSQLALSTLISKPEMILNCVGPAGIETVLRDQAWIALQSRWQEPSFALDIENRIEQSLQAKLATALTSEMVLAQADGFKATFQQESYEHTTTMNRLKGRLRVSMPAPEAWAHWVEGSTIKGFHDLVRSRLMQFFVFPDLMRYAKSTPFWFAFMRSGAVSAKCISDSRGSSLQITAPVGAWLQVKDTKRASGFKPLVYFAAPTRVSVSLPRASKGKAMAMSVDKMNLSYQFDDSYVKAERPNTNIAISLIRGQVLDMAKGLDLPTLPGGIGGLVRVLNQTDLSCSDGAIRWTLD